MIEPIESPPAPDPIAAIEQALDSPIDSKSIQGFHHSKSVAIAINDKTRPVPHAFLLPPLLSRLEALGIPPHRTTLIIATGAHPPMPPQEFSKVVPEDIIERYPIVCHNAQNPDSLVSLGTTSRGTPVWINKTFLDADLRIVVGNIEPHQFQGFSGGAKSAAIGLAGLETITRNHSLMIHPDARLGEYANNPARQDVEEIGSIIGIDFALNAILNERKEIVYVLAGRPSSIMERGIPLARHICQAPVASAFDLVIASPGGYPKDINLYQSQKGLAHARPITWQGGTIILAAACSEGTGSSSYESWMQGMNSHQQVMQRFQESGFRVGAHKAYQIARDATQINLLFFSEMPPDFARALLLNPVQDIQQAIRSTLATLSPDASIGIMPRAASTIPFIKP